MKSLSKDEPLLCVFIYRNPMNGTIQQADPRPPADAENPLPVGWTTAFDEEGVLYFIDHNNKLASYEDPRVVDDPTPARSLPQPEEGVAASLSVRLQRSKSSKNKVVWQLGARDVGAYEVLDDNLSQVEDIPECARNKMHNRFMDIIPNPASRVMLPEVDGDPTTAYVNANFIHGPDGEEKYYIAAMG